MLSQGTHAVKSIRLADAPTPEQILIASSMMGASSADVAAISSGTTGLLEASRSSKCLSVAARPK